LLKLKLVTEVLKRHFRHLQHNGLAVNEGVRETLKNQLSQVICSI